MASLDDLHKAMAQEAVRMTDLFQQKSTYEIRCPYICLIDAQYREYLYFVIQKLQEMVSPHFDGRIINISWESHPHSRESGGFVLKVTGNENQKTADEAWISHCFSYTKDVISKWTIPQKVCSGWETCGSSEEVV